MTKRKPADRPQKHTLPLFLPGLKEPVKFSIPMSDAWLPVDLTREERDAFNGKPGYAVECMNAQCGLREAGKFPHAVHLIEFTDSRAFVVDKVSKSGQPLHCIRYTHSNGDEQKEFDKPGGKKKLIATGLVERILRLLPPTDGTRHRPHGGRRPGAGPVPGSKHPRKGSFARALRRGLMDVV